MMPPTATTYTRRWNLVGTEFDEGLESRRSGFETYSYESRFVSTQWREVGGGYTKERTDLDDPFP